MGGGNFTDDPIKDNTANDNSERIVITSTEY